MLFGLSNYTYFQRLKILKLDIFELRRLRSDLTLLYKIIFGRAGIQRKNLISMQNRQLRQLRSHNYQIKPLHKFNAVRSDRNLFCRTTSIWNNLPTDTNFTSTKSFIESISSSHLVKYCKLNFS